MIFGKKKCQRSDHSEFNIQKKTGIRKRGVSDSCFFARTFLNVVSDEKSHRFSDTGRA